MNKDESEIPTMRLPMGGSPIAKAIKCAAFDKDILLTTNDRQFIRYVELIPSKAEVLVTRKRGNSHDVVTLTWTSESKASKTPVRGRAAFFDVGPWIVGRLTNDVDSLGQGNV